MLLIVVTNPAKNISPSPKGLMGLISFGGGGIFLFGGHKPPSLPMPSNVLEH